jgi:hypothetical protein
MNIQRDPDIVVATWLEEGPNELPDSTRRAILAAVPTITQRRRFAVLPWRVLPMNRVRLVLFTAVLAVAVGGLYYSYTRPNLSVVPAATSTPSAGPVAVMSLGTVILSDEGCDLEPGPWPAAGSASIDLANVSGSVGGFDLARIRPGFTFDDLRAWVDAENERLDTLGIGYNLQAPESADWKILFWTVKAGESASIPVANPGTYGMICFRYVSDLRTTRLHLVGPFKVYETDR